MTPSIWRNASETSLGSAPLTDSLSREFHKTLPSYESPPLRSLDALAKTLAVEAIYLKDESSRFGLPSFKILGASWGCYWAITSKLNIPPTMSVEDLRSQLDGTNLTVFAATDGNHGRAVAFMASLLNIKAEILVPEALDQYTQDAIASSGGIVTPIPAEYDGVVQEAERRARASGGVLVQDTSWPGYEEIPARIVDGYSTIFQELKEQLPRKLTSKDLVVVPVGVGSLAHASVLALKSVPNPPRIVAVEPETAACLNTSLRAGKLQSIDTSFTIMTGMNCGTVSHSAWEDLSHGIDISLSVSDSEAHNAVEYLQRLDIDSGPCGAACVAALRILAKENLLEKDSVVVVVNTEGRRPYKSFGVAKRDAKETGSK